MGRICSVRNCTSRKEKAKVTLFSAPENPEERKKWQNLLGLQLTALSLICERHFHPNSVKMECEFIDSRGKAQKVSIYFQNNHSILQ